MAAENGRTIPESVYRHRDIHVRPRNHVFSFTEKSSQPFSLRVPRKLAERVGFEPNFRREAKSLGNADLVDC